ncbi:family 78 glycoside hydrolase catalytic domain [Actinomadura barringtoniae]|uniref:alpha-L-rhamnosidase n=1 Tax=Actinomadura barringtoniae TaxID=1427535 RepID=A0A939T6V7_9ACTN|nr:family 78 glycoside hydrolase catalytic domain [Actinomadura barringtoniae]MBO2448687.1 family 78 glycoside hydrolase catalytic domain [Actinomadura barringtoniae]
MPGPSGLRVEHLDAPLGIGDRQPRLSWRLPPEATGQRAYRIRLDSGRETGWRDGDGNVLVPWPFSPLRSRERVRWQVQARTDRGESQWSPWCAFETGLLDAADWTARWIHPAENEPPPGPGRPTYELASTVVLDRPVAHARLYATAHGLYEAFLGGRRVGDLELTPGFTQYTRRLQVQTYDVTGLLAEGEQDFTVLLSDGWFRGQIGLTRDQDQWGTRTAFLAQLHIEHPDGDVTITGTDTTWLSRTSPILAADLIEGQREDRRPAASPPWQPVATSDLGYERLVVSSAPPVRVTQELRPVAVTRLGEGRHLVDLGQNITGRVRLSNLGPEGTRLTLVHGEALDASGDVTTDHLRPEGPSVPHPLPAGMVDQIISSGRDGEMFEPRHTVHGFQYVRIEGHPGEPSREDVTGVVVHTDMRRTGWFTCSDDRINRLHEAAVWSFRDNACDIPTDCPHRERAGWTGDWQLFAPTAAFLYDVAGFSLKWLRDVAVDQWEDGTVTSISPSAPAHGKDSPAAFIHGSAGWGDAIVLVPWELYRAYGDTGVLTEMWPHMVRWLDRAERMAAHGRHPSRTGPARPHERYVWDTGFHWGEWLEPGADLTGSLEAFVALDKSDVATAYFARSADLAGRIAEILGLAEDSDRYTALAGQVRAAWRAEFLDADRAVRPATQANLVRALRFGLVPDDLRDRVAAQLVALIRAAGTHLGTGFLATPDLLPVLADTGHADVAYELLFQDTPPSWLHMIDCGATTVWEHWDGIRDDGTPHDSLNHYSKGAVIGFLHRYVAGIRPGARGGYRHLRIEPVPGGSLTSASAAHDSPHGRIESSWSLDRDVLRLSVLIPPGTTADVVLPGRPPELVGPGRHHFTTAETAETAETESESA